MESVALGYTNMMINDCVLSIIYNKTGNKLVYLVVDYMMCSSSQSLVSTFSTSPFQTYENYLIQSITSNMKKDIVISKRYV